MRYRGSLGEGNEMGSQAIFTRLVAQVQLRCKICKREVTITGGSVLCKMSLAWWVRGICASQATHSDKRAAVKYRLWVATTNPECKN